MYMLLGTDARKFKFANVKQHCSCCHKNLQDEGIGGQAEPEMGGAAAPAAPQRMTHAERISSSKRSCCLAFTWSMLGVLACIPGSIFQICLAKA